MFVRLYQNLVVAALFGAFEISLFGNLPIINTQKANLSSGIFIVFFKNYYTQFDKFILPGDVRIMNAFAAYLQQKRSINKRNHYIFFATFLQVNELS